VSAPPDHQIDAAARPSVHATAIVEDGAHLGPGTRVWHQAHVRSGARIGTEVVLGKNVFVDSGVAIGDRSKVQNNVSVYAGVTLEDEVFVGPSAVFTNDLRPRAAGGAWQLVPTVVRRGASLGGGAVVVCGVEIGPWAMVAAGSVVTRSVPAHALVMGNPARVRGWVCRCGEVVSREPQPPADLTCPACRLTDSDARPVTVGSGVSA
jgi:UDP-2-acetamido-3-amino-2,3-dideoxy-glucuronate N-acetyltransferase